MKPSILAVALVLAFQTVAGAQEPLPAVRPVVSAPDDGFFGRSDLWNAASLAAAIAMSPLDRSLTGLVRDDEALANPYIRHASHAISFLGGSAPMIIGGAAYLAGRHWHMPGVTDVALHTTEAMVTATAVSSVLKVTVGRSRPFMSNDGDSDEFRLSRSSNFQSFPSGHTTAAFALAAALTSESDTWWPHHHRLVGTALYGAATLVGLSRIYDDKHWASDVAAGAAIGTFSGLTIVRFNHLRLMRSSSH
jgi:membrane-associated phospholipid phosphatase